MDEKKSDINNDIIEMRYKHFDVKCETYFTNLNNSEGNLDNISSKITFIDGITNIAYQHKFELNEGIDSVKKFPELIKRGLNPNDKNFEFQYRIENNILKASITKILNDQYIDNPVYKFELIRVKKPLVNMEILMNKFKEMENEIKSLKIELKKVKRDNAKLKKCVTGDISYTDTWKGYGTKNKKNDDFGSIKWMKFGQRVIVKILCICLCKHIHMLCYVLLVYILYILNYSCKDWRYQKRALIIQIMLLELFLLKYDQKFG